MTKKLKVFETFSGIGAQAKALKNAKISYEIVATSGLDKPTSYICGVAMPPSP